MVYIAVGVRTPVSASSSHALPGFDFLTVGTQSAPRVPLEYPSGSHALPGFDFLTVGTQSAPRVPLEYPSGSQALSGFDC